MGEGSIMSDVFLDMPRIPEELFKYQEMLNRITNSIAGAIACRMNPPGTAIRDSWEQVRFPRSKKRRIRKKFSKNRDNYGHVRRMVYLYKADNPRQSIKVEGFGLPKLP